MTKESNKDRLYLTIKKEPFEMIKNGIKLEEYRDINEYYDKKFSRPYKTVLLQNGYSPDSPRIEVEILSIVKKRAVPEWCGGYNGILYAIKLGKILTK